MPAELQIVEQVKELNGKATQAEAAKIIGCSIATVRACCQRYNIYWIPQLRDQRGTNNHNYKDGLGKSTIERLTGRILSMEGRNLHKCERCGFESVQELPRHHKDRNRANNSIENLEVLCQGCHNKAHMREQIRDELGRFT